MTINPHPVVLAAIASQRQESLRAQSAQDRLAVRAARSGGIHRPRRWPDLVAAAVCSLGIGALLAGTSAIAPEA